MTLQLPRLRSLASNAAQVRADRERRPLDYMRWTPPQLAFLRDPSRYRLLRLGQQLGGKTTVGLADTIWRCLGKHPFQDLRPHPSGRPFQAWIVCTTHEQSLQIQAKLHALLPKDEWDSDKSPYQGLAKGFRGKHTSVTFRNGATIFLKTTRQGAEALASGTVDHIQVDEPTTESCWQEVKGRVRRSGGTISATLTPINIPCDHLRRDAESGLLSDHCFPLTEANATPEGAARPLRTDTGQLIDEAFIAEERRATPPDVAGIVLDGEWEVRGVDRYFSCFIGPGLPGSHVTDLLPKADYEVRIGIDHGDRPGKQIASLFLIERLKGRQVRVYLWDEYVDLKGIASPQDDARGILEMLARNELTWGMVRKAKGDRIHLKGRAREKSNTDLQRFIARELAVPFHDLRPQIVTAKKGEGRGAGSVRAGSRWLFHLIAKGAFRIHPRCERNIAAFNEWTGPGPDCDEKDPIDAARYALDDYIFARWTPFAAAGFAIG